jgi:hypothetical protein
MISTNLGASIMALKLKPCFGSLALQESSVIFRSYSESAVAINNSELITNVGRDGRICLIQALGLHSGEQHQGARDASVPTNHDPHLKPLSRLSHQFALLQI